MKLRYKILNSIVGLIAISIIGLALTLGYTSDCEDILPIENKPDGMNAVAHYCYGSADLLKLEKVEKPTPSVNEVLVKIHRAAVNPLDYYLMRGAPYFMRLSR